MAKFWILIVWILLSIGTVRTTYGQPIVSVATCASVDMDQNWNEAAKQKFWFTTQGSQIMPYKWFLALEVPWENLLFKDAHVMDTLLGYINLNSAVDLRVGAQFSAQVSDNGAHGAAREGIDGSPFR
jgi:hypothetical protein